MTNYLVTGYSWINMPDSFPYAGDDPKDDSFYTSIQTSTAYGEETSLDETGGGWQLTGTGITYDKNGNPISGTFTGLTVYDLDLVEGETYEKYHISGFSISAKALSDAHATKSNADDLALFKSIFSGNDYLLGGKAHSNTIYGYDGNDTVSGGSHADALYGGAGHDIIVANGGADYIDGGAGADVMYGGSGNDTYVVDQPGDHAFETGSGGVDLIRTSLDNYVLGKNLENLTLVGASAHNGTGNEFANTIVGTAGANILKGLAGSDTLIGNGGDDHLYGSYDNDTLEGGTGADTFHFLIDDTGRLKTTADTIVDFSSRQHDIIDLSAIDANENRAGNQSFHFIGTQAYSHRPEQLGFLKTAHDTYVFGDTNADGKSDFMIRLVGAMNLTAADFHL